MYGSFLYLPPVLPQPMSNSVTLDCLEPFVVQDAVQKLVASRVPLSDSLHVRIASLHDALREQSANVRPGHASLDAAALRKICKSLLLAPDRPHKLL